MRQGCPLSPLVIEGLSRIIFDANLKGRLSGIKISSALHITHLFFVDDVVLFGKYSLDERSTFYEIIYVLCSALGMEISMEKSTFYQHKTPDVILSKITTFFPFKLEHIESRFKYLGHILKLYNYKIEYWMWFIKNIKKDRQLGL